MARNAQTTVTHERGGYRITRTSDGYSVLLTHVGRCWRLYMGSDSVDIAGRESSSDEIIRYVRRALREDGLPLGDMHCTGW